MNRQKELLMEGGEEAGDGRAEGSSAIGDGGPAAVSLMPGLGGMHVHIFESSRLEGSCVADLLSWWPWSSPQWSYVHTFTAAITGTMIERCCDAAGRPGTPVRLRSRTLVVFVFCFVLFLSIAIHQSQNGSVLWVRCLSLMRA